jgi:small subunit ribosomal protein S20
MMRRENVFICKWRKVVANIKSQIKRNRQNDKRRLRNRVYRGEARIAVKNARTNIEEGLPESQVALKDAISALDKAARKGVIHRNNAARRKSRLVKAYSKIVPLPVEAPGEMVEQASEVEATAAAPRSPRKAPGERKISTRKTTAKSPSKEKKLIESEVEVATVTGAEAGEKTSIASPKTKKPATKKATTSSSTKKKPSSTKKTTSKKPATASSKAKKT